MIRPTARASLRAFLLGAALLAGGGAGAAAEESCFAKSAMDRMPDWVQARGEFFRRYVSTLRISEESRLFRQDTTLLARHACGCPGETVAWDASRSLVPEGMWEAEFQDWAAEERRIRKTYADYRNLVVIPRCADQKKDGN